MKYSRKIILASKSPRRSALLQAAGFDFEVRTQDVDESYPSDLPKEEVAKFLAIKKARSVAQSLTDDELLLTADSIVLLEGIIYSKPTDEADAHKILSALSGKTHTVITGVCLKSKTKEVAFDAHSKVEMQVLSPTEIDYYVSNFKPFDKAGAYAIQEWIGLCKVSSIQGTYSNIMGLPMEAVYRELMNF